MPRQMPVDLPGLSVAAVSSDRQNFDGHDLAASACPELLPDRRAYTGHSSAVGKTIATNYRGEQVSLAEAYKSTVIAQINFEGIHGGFQRFAEAHVPLRTSSLQEKSPFTSFEVIYG